MKLAIIGLGQSGKATVFQALTGASLTLGNKTESHIGTIQVPDERVDKLSAMYNPRKTIYAQVEYFLPATKGAGEDKKSGEQAYWAQVRDGDALIHCVRNYDVYGTDAPTPLEDFQRLDQELIFADLVSVEKRLERLKLEQKRGKKPDPEERDLLGRCHRELENERPLRRTPELAAAPKLRGFTFPSAKPQLVLFNNSDEDDRLPIQAAELREETALIIRGKLEQELAGMSPGEAAEFLTEFGLEAAAADRIIQKSYERLGLISFFTVGEDEVRAWTIPRSTAAVDAAEVIHSDIKKGFIRAEVLAYGDLMEAGRYAEARKRGTVRLEGKQYEVKDGDIINFRFNV
ncbi:MAG: redox-regulated ATPase YchF [Desulfosarcina sp.]|nr:redox-regulated ATPase YchF [Desulfobacterales bacterium]